MKKKCPTCGSENKGYKYYCDAMDADIPFKGIPSKKETNTVVGNGWWYTGYCPDTWHD